MPTGTEPAPHALEPLAAPSKVGRTLAVVAVLAMVLFWIWILSGGPRTPNADRLDDRAYVARTERRCEQLRTDLQALPSASATPTAAERADVLDRATGLVAEMVDDIEADAPRSGDDAVSLESWFADWRTYLADRQAYADRLRVDPGAKFLVSENAEFSDSVDKTIEVFAEDANDIDACATPGDVG